MRQISGRSLVTALIFVALAAEGVWLAGHVLFSWGSQTYPPTPTQLTFEPPVPPPGSDVLLRLSAVAASQSSPQWPAGAAYAYVKIRNWHLRTHGAQARMAGLTSASWRARSELPALSASRAGAEHLLAAGSRSGGWAPGWEFADLSGLTRSQPIPGGAQALLLRQLAAIPGIVNDGTTTDRAGRSGAAVSLDSSYSGEPITYTLILDPGTGGLLESDETLSGPPHRLNALKGSVVAFTTFLSSGYVASRRATAVPSP
ncbi:MAG: hypothetical protein WAU75_01185 [Solirubrobacteraceae bacterium]